MSSEMTPRKPLRLWPGVIAGTLLSLSWWVVPAVAPAQAMFGLLGGLICGLIILVWWLLFSRAAWRERLGAIVLMVVALAATSQVVHPSVRGGMMGFMLFVYSIPVLSLGLAVGAVGRSRKAMVAAILIACASLTLIRTNGMDGQGVSDIQWRWTPTAEQRLLARADEPPAASQPQPVVAKPEDVSIPKKSDERAID